MRKLLLAAAVAAAALAAHAGDIYVWTDENGKTHLADSVPPKYRKSAVRIDSSQFELSPEQQREAAAARAALAKKASAASAPLPGSAQPAAPSGAAPRASPLASAPADECETLQRQYRESLECFAPYMNANGSLKPGAFTACRTVVNPTLKCGSAKSY